MNTIDYVIDILLIAVIFRLVRPRELSPRAAVLPLALLAAAGVIYLRPISLGGNDLLLIVVLTVAGVLLGLLSGFADRIWFEGAGKLFNQATRWSVLAWVAGMGFRFAFAYYAYHSGGPAVARFSASHHITGAQAWTTALFLMAAGQVIARLGLLQVRRINTIRQAAATGPSPEDDLDGRASGSPRVPDTM
jgi:hypothetical protein